MSEDLRLYAADLESNTAEMHIERMRAQQDLDESIESLDLFAASMASFRHAYASAQLQDPKEAQTHMLLAALFAEADIRLGAYDINNDIEDVDFVEEPIEFDKEVGNTTYIDRIVSRDRVWRQNMREQAIRPEEWDDALAARDAVGPAIEEAEIRYNSNVLSSSEKNQVLTDAIVATGRLIFVRSVLEDDRLKLLSSACILADHLEINDSLDSARTALAAYQLLSAMAIATQGKTMFALKQARTAFKNIGEGPYCDVLGEDAKENMATVNKAIVFKLAQKPRQYGLTGALMFSGRSPFSYCEEDVRPTLSRASRRQQRKAHALFAELESGQS